MSKTIAFLMTEHLTLQLTKDQLQFIVECLQDHELKTGYETRLSIKLKKLLAQAKTSETKHDYRCTCETCTDEYIENDR